MTTCRSTASRRWCSTRAGSSREKHPKIAERITPQLLSIYFRYIRNLSLLDRRLTPDLYTLIVAAKQTAGDDFALALAETARSYPCGPDEPDERAQDLTRTSLGLRGWESTRASCPSGARARWSAGCRARLFPGGRASCGPSPRKPSRARWRQRWDPFGMCSYPPEDDRIESFHRHVRDQAKAILGADLARTEKFTTSVRDGIDIRETLRNWHTGDLYVKVVPPGRGSIEVVVFLFDLPADPEVYTNRTTWYAEHTEESTLAFYATDPMKNLVGPGIAQAEYGGALFIFPPRPIPDIWTDTRLDFADTLEERLLAGCVPAQQRPARRGRQPQDSLRRRGAGSPGGSAGRSSTCRSSGSAASCSSGCARSTCSTASKSGPTRPITFATCEHIRRPDVVDFDSASLLGRGSAGRRTSAAGATEPFEAPKYGLATQIPKDWTVAVHEEDDRIFVAIIPQTDFDRPGIAACELALAPESLEEYRTRIDTNAQKNGRPSGKLAVEPDHQRRPRRTAGNDLGVSSRRRRVLARDQRAADRQPPALHASS